jgi:hypothetical protein
VLVCLGHVNGLEEVVVVEEGKVDRWWVDGVLIGAQKKAARPGDRPFWSFPSWNKVTLKLSGLGFGVWGLGIGRKCEQ